MNIIATRIQAFVGYFSDMVSIHAMNRAVNIRFRLGLIGERRQLITHYLLLKEIRKANLRLLRYGFKRGEVDTPDWPKLIRRCRRETLAYIQKCRREEHATRQGVVR